MASPWKLLVRLVSPRRQQGQEQGLTDDVKLDVLAIAKRAEANFDNGLSAADPPVDEKAVADEQLEAVPASPEHSEEAAIGLRRTADIECGSPSEAAESVLSDNVNASEDQAPKPSSHSGEAATRKRSKWAKATKAIGDAPPPAPTAPVASDHVLSLDEEIRLLRDQLARKLRLQNAQLKRMLERFER
ncbi:hypothetical protein E5S70_24315 [Ensifer adhaerens]|nr:hypothetical protein [Ensifer canadensis]NOV19168.1 hypothetical protein [Ensifer canadensis]